MVNDACWLREHAINGLCRVLILDVYGCFPQIPTGILPWLEIIQGAGFDADRLQKWLGWKEGSSDGVEEDQPRVELLGQEWVENLKQRILAHSWTGSGATDFDSLVKEKFVQKYIGQKTTPLLLASSTPGNFYYGLIRLGGKYGRIEHDLNRAMSDPNRYPDNKSYWAELGRLHNIRQFVYACQDMLMGLRYPMPKPEDGKNVLLLIDDHPELIDDQLGDVIDQHASGYHLWTWKPPFKDLADEKGRQGATGRASEPRDVTLLLTLDDLADYNSLRSSRDLRNHRLKLQEWTPLAKRADPDRETAEPVEKSLKDVLSNCAYIFVDVLFDRPGGGEDEIGGRVIEGLTRIIRDVNISNDEGDDDTSKKRIPAIVALSRAEDLDKVQTCLRSGASGYLLKSRLLALPSVLGRVHQPVSEAVGTWHRNFRLLYNLPCEVIGLLKTAMITRDVDFSKRELPEGVPDNRQRAMAELLAAIPKTDLHVHVGSLMSAEFLVIASLVMLVRHRPGSKEPKQIWKAMGFFNKFWNGEVGLYLHPHLAVLDPKTPHQLSFTEGEDGVQYFADGVRKFLISQIEPFNKAVDPNSEPTAGNDGIVNKRYYSFRSVLHNALGVRDYWPEARAIEKIRDTPNLVLFFFAHAYSATKQESGDAKDGEDKFSSVFDKDRKKRMVDVLRMFILYLASGSNTAITLGFDKLLEEIETIRNGADDDVKQSAWNKLHKHFYTDWNGISLDYILKISRNDAREPSRPVRLAQLTVRLCAGGEKPTWAHNPLLGSCPSFDDSPIQWLLGTGTRCKNLATYLEGCELAGAEHLKHPYLIRLYAQHVVRQFVELGVLYAELRAAVSGYECPEINFSFQDACEHFLQAFTQAQDVMYKKYHREEGGSDWLWKEPFGIGDLFRDSLTLRTTRFPVKVGVILTGKRHKSSREILQEAAAAVVSQTRPPASLQTAREFVEEQMTECRLAGFDLAGQEEDHPPEHFRGEFEQLARLHIPITAHAGENAPSGYIESAILDLRASRLGHGLTLPEDPQLMGRVREDGICVELCPVSNFQTSRFAPAGTRDPEREYPLRKFIENGNAFCINTDNPIISYTNIVKEYFQASYAYGGDGLSLWELLRIIRMGFVHSFMSLPERRAIMELADQILFDLFSQEDVVALLRELASDRP